MKVLVFEADSEFAGHLRDGLGRLGFDSSIVDDANAGLQAAASDKPDLILLSIELPRMNGFSVCNKLKRDPALKDVPLIIMSSDSTEETFEQHRRLRTRAEDYVHKPISFPDLMARARAFVSVPEIAGGATDPPMSGDEIVMDDEIVIDDVEPVSISEEPAEAPAEPVDGDVSDFADNAFDALTKGAAAAPPVPNIEPEHEPVAAEPEVGDQRPRGKPRSSIPPRPMTDGALATASQAELDRQKNRVTELEKELSGARDKISQLEGAASSETAKDTEVVKLRRELDDTKAKLASAGKGGGSSAREFLDLRQQLNEKDKELLGLRDQLGSKDKELIALRDSALGVERDKADLNDKIIELEKHLLDHQRSLETVRADKEQASKRAEDFRRKIEKLQGDLEAKTRELEDARSSHEGELATRDAKAASDRVSHQEALEAAEATRQADVASAEEQGRKNLDDAVTRARETAAAEQAQALEEAAEAAEQAQRDAVTTREAELKKESDSRMAALHRANEDAMNKLKAEQAQTLREAEEAAAQRLAEREAELHGEIGTVVTQMTEAHDATKASLSATRQELADLGTAKEEGEARRDAQIAALTGDLQQRREELEVALKTVDERDAKIVDLEGDLGETRDALTEANRTIQDRDAKINALESELVRTKSDLEQTQVNLSVESGRLSKARDKWTEDRASLEHAKDALASALAQIEDAENRSFD
jgi:CheY-like chemotaxis protein